MGPAAVYAIALRHEKTPVLASVEIPVDQKHSPTAIQLAGETALAQLKARLGADFEILALLTLEKAFEELRWEPYPSVVISEASAPRDLHTAKQMASNHWERRMALLHEEFPDLPWNKPEISNHAEALKTFGPLGLYDVTDTELAPHWSEITRRKKLLLHVCCGPDAAGVIQQLKRDYDVVGFWYDPNIQPREEYDLRLEAFEKVAKLENIPYIVGEYDVDRFLEGIRGLEHTPEQGAKCSVCYDMRLERSAVEARAAGCDLYTTTLAISPHKVQEKLKNFGALNEKKYGIPYLAKNFMKDDGFKDSVDYTEQHGIYRQDYCGCLFSLHEGGPEARKKARELGLTGPSHEQNSEPANPRRSYG